MSAWNSLNRDWSFDKRGFYQLFANALLDDFSLYKSKSCTISYNCHSKDDYSDEEEEEIEIQASQLDRAYGGIRLEELLGDGFSTKCCTLNIDYGKFQRRVELKNCLGH